MFPSRGSSKASTRTRCRPSCRPPLAGVFPRFPAFSTARSTLAAGPGIAPARGAIPVPAAVTRSPSPSQNTWSSLTRASESFPRLCGMRPGCAARTLPGLGPVAPAPDTALPKGSGPRYSAAQGPRSEVYPTHLLDGMLYCAQCSKRVGLVSGRHGGYYGCHTARRCLCDNRLTVCRSLVERVFLAGLRARLLEPGVVRYALGRVAAEVARLSGDVADLRRAKQAELAEARRRLERILEFIATGQGAGSDALGAQLAVAERRVTQLDVELAALQGRDGPVLAVPSEEWVVERVRALQQVLERRTVKSALVLRRLLGKVVLDAVRSDSGRSHYVARTQIDTFVLVEPSGPRGGPDGGSRPLQWWTCTSVRVRARSSVLLPAFV